MEVGASCSSSQHYPLEVDQLFEAFGSAFSIESIASTYIQANRDIEMAGDLLYELQARAASTASHQPMDDADKSPRVSAESEPHPFVSEGDSKALGLDAGLTGKDYAGLGSSKILSGESIVSEFSELCSKTSSSSGGVKTETSHEDVCDFLFKMLGYGFQLDMEVIHEVLSTCGYDMEKSMEALLERSASTLGKSEDTLGKAPEVVSEDTLSKAPEVPLHSYKKMMDISCLEKSQNSNSKRSSKKRNKVKNDLEKELLQSLFNVSERVEDKPKKCLPLPRREIDRSGRYGTVVTGPLEDTLIEHKTIYTIPRKTSKDVEDKDDDSFNILIQSTREHWATMKEYYKAAAEAFVKGDHAQATGLMVQGHFFSKKAREVDDMSLQKIMETREEEEDLVLDITVYEPRESAQHLKNQLLILCGISAIPFLNIKLGNGEEGSKVASRKRRILKLLEKESIKWTETENGQMLTIRVDEINPKSLSFSKK